MPCRLLIDDAAAYHDSALRVIDFLKTRPLTHILGGHIELNSRGMPVSQLPTVAIWVYLPRYGARVIVCPRCFTLPFPFQLMKATSGASASIQTVIAPSASTVMTSEAKCSALIVESDMGRTNT